MHALTAAGKAAKNTATLVAVLIIAVASATFLSGCGGGGGGSTPSNGGNSPGVINLLPTAAPSVQALVTEKLDHDILVGYQFINQRGDPIPPTDPTVQAVLDAARNPKGTLAIFDCESPGTKGTPQYVAIPTKVSSAPGAATYTCAYGPGSAPEQSLFVLTVDVSTDADGKMRVTDTFSDKMDGGKETKRVFGPAVSNGTLVDVMRVDMFNYLGTGRAGADQTYVDEFTGPLALVITG